MPDWKTEIARRLASLKLEPGREAEVTEELAQHLEDRFQELVSGGDSEDRAQRTALADLRDEDLLARGLNGVEHETPQRPIVLGSSGGRNPISSLWHDIFYAMRTLWRSPGFALAAILTLALGIGANTAIFSLTDALLLKNLPVKNPNQLLLFGSAQQWGVIGGWITGNAQIFSYPQYEDFRDHDQWFRGLCAFQSIDDPLAVRIPGRGAAQQVAGKLVSGSYFDVLGVRPIIGRTLTPADDRVGATPAAVISYRFWNRAFARDPAAVGKTIEINGAAFTIVGVAPQGFFGETIEPDPPDFWLPISTQPQVTQYASMLQVPDVRWLYIIGRLKPGVSRRQAEVGLTVQLRELLSTESGNVPAAYKDEYEKSMRRARIELSSSATGVSHLRFHYAEPLYVLLGIALAVLLVACTNIANLMLARATTRHREISTRLAIGASHGRMMRQLFTESLLLAACGAAAGLLLALWGTNLLTSLAFRGAGYMPFRASLDLRVLAFTLAVTVATGIAFGLAPALRVRRVNLAEALKSGARTPGSESGGGRRFRLDKALVVAQVALSTVLLIVAGLFVRTLAHLERENVGFVREHVLVVKIDPLIADYKFSELPELYQNLQRRIEALPGVESASLALYGPMGTNWSSGISIEGRPTRPDENLQARWDRVSPSFFKTLGMPILLGRALAAEDMGTATHAAVINETMASRYFPHENPIGHHFGFGSARHSSDFVIVGVVRNSEFLSPREKVPPTAFLPFFAMRSDRWALSSSADVRSNYAGWLGVRTVGDPRVLAKEVRETIAQVDPSLPVASVTTLSDQVDESMNQERLVSDLSAGFGILALLIAGIGLYGLIAYLAARRTGEIGLRMALGAETGDVLRMVLRQGLALAVLGVAVGLGCASAVARLLASLLYGVKPGDPLTFIAVSVLLAAVALAACYFPARRAAKVDPMVALKYE